MSTLDLENSAKNDGERLQYETPELIDRGDVSKETQTAVNTTGTDGGYS